MYDYTPTRSRAGPRTFLGGFRDDPQADAYAGYDTLYAIGRVIEVGWEPDTDALREGMVRGFGGALLAPSGCTEPTAPVGPLRRCRPRGWDFEQTTQT